MQSEEKMTPLAKSIRVIWLIVAVLVAYGSTVGGDTSILCGWLFLVWAAPFSILWWFYLYDVARVYMASSVAQPIGLVLVIVLAYAFWFWLIPMIRAKASTPKGISQ
jgi:hypothetical protein